MTDQSLLAAVNAAANGPVASSGAPAPSPAPTAMTADRLKAEHPAVASAIAQDAAKAERDRISAIRAAMLPGQDALAQKMIDEGVSVGEAALRLNQAYRASLDARAQALKDNEKALADTGVKPGLSPTGLPPKMEAAERGAPKTDQQLKDEYQASAALQAEFRNEAAYVALMKAEASGRIRRLKRHAA